MGGKQQIFAEKCVEMVSGSAPLFFSLLINLAFVAMFASIVIRPALESRTGTITAALGKFLEDTPEVENPNVNPQPLSTALSTASQAIMTHMPVVSVPITTTAPSALKISLPVVVADANLVADAMAVASNVFVTAQQGATGSNSRKHQIGAMTVKANRLCVILDTSPSMVDVSNESLRTAQHIARASGGEVHQHAGCAIRKGSILPGDSEGDNLYGIIQKLIKSRKMDAIYWVCDLEDEQDPEAIAELKKLLLENRVRFYVSSYQYRPSLPLMELIQETGGEFEMKSLLDKD